jgi:LmbE family N-acetylglucosaminyl deacetylase
VKDHQAQFTKECLGIAKKAPPDLVMSFGPDGWTGHRDHIATYYAAAAIAKRLAVPHYVATPAPHRHEQTKQSALRGQVNPHYDEIAPYQMATTYVSVSRAFKHTVLSFYPSQISPRRSGRKHVPGKRPTMTREYFALMPHRLRSLNKRRSRK